MANPLRYLAWVGQRPVWLYVQLLDSGELVLEGADQYSRFWRMSWPAGSDRLRLGWTLVMAFCVDGRPEWVRLRLSDMI